MFLFESFILICDYCVFFVAEIARECRKRAHWPEDTPLTLYEEIQAGNVEKVNTDLN